MTEYPVTGPPAFQPSHPGRILREDVLPELGISVSHAARELGVTRQTLHRILAEQASVTPEMALRLGRFCGNGPDLWLALQQAHDLWAVARGKAGELAKVRQFQPLTSAARDDRPVVTAEALRSRGRTYVYRDASGRFVEGRHGSRRNSRRVGTRRTRHSS